MTFDLRFATAIGLVLATLAAGAQAAGDRPPPDPNMFGIYTSRLDGSDLRRIVSDPTRELNHARVSPDKKWITFTRYNHVGRDGLAKEENGYEETEIMLCGLDGSDVQVLVPSRKGKVAANGYWTEDGKAILYVSNDNPGSQGQINRYDLATRRSTKVTLAGELWAADPHQVGNHLAVSVFDPKAKSTSIWVKDVRRGTVRQLTFQKRHGIDPDTRQPLGDFDPKLSPDGSRLVTMRNMGGHNWHAVVVDLESGRERDISAEKAVDGVPEWSSDGRKLIFWHANLRELKKSGLYTMNPEGEDRRRIPLPGGHFYTMPAFFPGEGSGDSARIIFSAQKNPLL